MRANLRAALGVQIDTPDGRRELRRLRSRAAARGWQKPDPLEALGGLLPRPEFSFFRF